MLTNKELQSLRNMGNEAETAADEIKGLRTLMIELLEILRNWEPDNASGEERQTILQAMCQTGILTPPTETLRNMTEADFVIAHG